MPLDRINGEFVPLYGQHDLPIPPNGKWRETPMFEAARADALRVFRKEAKRSRSEIKSRIDDEDWFAQTYAKQGRIVFFFQKLIPIREKTFSSAVVQERFHAVPIVFGIDEVRELHLRGMWPFVPDIILKVTENDMRKFLPGGHVLSKTG